MFVCSKWMGVLQDANLQSRLKEKERSLENLQRLLNQKINEKDLMIMNLQRDNKVLAEEKFNLMSRLETARDRTDTDLEAMSLKVSLVDSVEGKSSMKHCVWIV